MAKKASERHTAFISVVFLPAEGKAIEKAAKRAHMKKSAYLRMIAMERIEADSRRRK